MRDRAASAPSAALPERLLALEMALDAFVEALAQVEYRLEVAEHVREAKVQPQPQRARAQRAFHVVEAAVLVHLLEEPRRAGATAGGVVPRPFEKGLHLRIGAGVDRRLRVDEPLLERQGGGAAI